MAPSRPLVVTGDPETLDDVLRLADLAPVEVDVAVDAVDAQSRWLAAPVVLLGEDVVASPRTELAALPPRDEVVLICRPASTGSTVGATRPLAASDLPRVPTTIGAVVYLPGEEHLLLERLKAATQLGRPATGRTVCVVGGCGGAGASVLAAALALTAASQDGSAFLVDLDQLGGGIDLLLGLEEHPGLRWAAFAGTSGRLVPTGLRAALPSAHGVAVLACGRQAHAQLGPDAVRAVLTAGHRGGGLVVVDLPRHRHPAVEVALAQADVLVLVVPAQVRAAAAALHVIDEIGGSGPPTVLVVRRSPGDRLPARSLADVLGLPLAAEFAPEPSLHSALAQGRPPGLRRSGPLAVLSRTLIERWIATDGAMAA